MVQRLLNNLLSSAEYSFQNNLGLLHADSEAFELLRLFRNEMATQINALNACGEKVSGQVSVLAKSIRNALVAACVSAANCIACDVCESVPELSTYQGNAMSYVKGYALEPLVTFLEQQRSPKGYVRVVNATYMRYGLR